MCLVAVDAHCKWPEVAIMKSTTFEKTVEELGEIVRKFVYDKRILPLPWAKSLFLGALLTVSPHLAKVPPSDDSCFDSTA